MDPKVVLVFTWIVAGLVVAAYIWFVVWRFRVERRKKEAQAITDTAMSDAIARTAEQAAPARRILAPSPSSADPASAPAAPVVAPAAITVAGLLSGIAPRMTLYR